MKVTVHKTLLPGLVCLCFLISPYSAAAKDFIYAPLVNALQIIDCDTDTVVETIPYNDYIVNASFSPDGKRYYLNAFHSIYVIDTATNKLIDTHKFSSDLSKVTILGFAVSQDGGKFYLSCSIVKKKQNIPRLNVLPPQLVVYDIKTKKMVKNFPIPYCVTGVVSLRNDPEHVILIGLNMYKLNVKNGKSEKIMGLLEPEEGKEGKNTLVIWQNGSPDDHGLFSNPYYTAAGMGYFFIDRESGEVSTLEGKDVWFEYSTIVSPDKKYMYGVMDELVKIDLKTGETVKSVQVKTGTNYALSMTADGKKVYVGPAGNDMSVYDAETLELIGVIPLEGDGVIAHRLTR
jgi:DNA-binding beta-propeller fold protein YncE